MANLQAYIKRKLERKWKSLEARGLKRPKNWEENRKRVKEAHGH